MEDHIHAHPTAIISPEASIGEGTSVWHHAQVREGACIGRNCVLSKGVYVDAGVIIGDNVKIQNYVSIYRGVAMEDGVFCGPHCVFTNDKRPRAINVDGSLKGADDWDLGETLLREGASIGANAVVLCGVTIGAWAMVGAGSIVTRDVPDHGLVWGNPARLCGFVCACGQQLHPVEARHPLVQGSQPSSPRASTARTPQTRSEEEINAVTLLCPSCGARVYVSAEDWERVR